MFTFNNTKIAAMGIVVTMDLSTLLSNRLNKQKILSHKKRKRKWGN